MAGFVLTIKNAEETIELSSKATEGKDDASILDIDFRMNTLKDDTRNRADGVRCELVITGLISEDIKDETKRLAKWSMDSDKNTLYRDVALVVYEKDNLTGNVLRRYEFNSMFVIDYEESFGSKIQQKELKGISDEKGVYTLFLAQKEGNNKKEVFSS